MNNKVIFTGAHGTGKTSVLRMFEADGEYVITEVVRKIAKEGLPINEDGGTDTQKKIFSTYEMEFGITPSFISDRGLTDVLAYTTVAVADGKVDVHFLRNQEKKFEKFHNRHTDIKYVYFPIEFDIEDDGVRSINKEYQTRIDRNIKNILDSYKLNYITVHGTPEERYQQIKEWLA